MRIKEARLKHKLSQAKIAKELGISQSNYSKFEREEISPNVEILKKLANIYKLSIDELIGVETSYTISKFAFSDKQLAIIEQLKKLDDNQCDKVSAFIEGLKEGKK